MKKRVLALSLMLGLSSAASVFAAVPGSSASVQIQLTHRLSRKTRKAS